MESSTITVKKEFEDILEDKPDLVNIEDVKILNDDSANNFMRDSFWSANVKSEFKEDNESSCISSGNQCHINETNSEKEENICSIESDENREIISKSEKKCQLCLQAANTSDFVLFNEMDREILEKLLTNDVKESAPSVICNDCSNMLHESFAFKSSCLYTEDSLTPFINTQNLGKLDISTVFHKIHNDKRSLLPKNANICRFCLKILENVSFTFLKDLSQPDLEMLKKVMPEMQLEATIDPIICEVCLYSFQDSFKFINVCLNTLKVSHNDNSTSLNSNMFKCQVCSFITTYKSSLTRHMYVHKDHDVQVYECDKCPFKSKYKINMSRHNLVHKKPEEAKLYKCDKCSFQSKYKINVSRHNLVHMKPEEVELYKCELCQFSAKDKTRLIAHLLVHKKPEEVKMHKCDRCSFQSKYKHNLTVHKLVHEKSKEVKLYNCQLCQFSTKYKNSYVTHQIVHKKREEAKLHKCDKCPFQSRHKGSLTMHNLVHKKPEEAKLYKCDKCPFRSKYKVNISRHNLVHM